MIPKDAIMDGAKRLIEAIRSVIYIDARKLELLIAAKIAGGHVILADFHGVGKTSLARALAGAIEWKEDSSSKAIRMEPFSRVQCTVDLLPQDIIGYTRIEGDIGNLVFHRGPIFAHFVLCDEINLLTPKTQGSFFQAMEEQSVTAEGETYPLHSPFFIIATMNLKGAHLFPLPAPQLDRFMLQISLGFPEEGDEKGIVKHHGRNDSWKDFKPAVSVNELIEWQSHVDSVAIHDDVIDYIVRFVRETRKNPAIETPASPRAGVRISRLVRALSLLRGYDYVTIDTVKEVLIPTLAHRITTADTERETSDIIEEMKKRISVDRR